MAVNVTHKDISNYINEQLERSRYALARELCYIGEKCVNQARTAFQSGEGKHYTDRTGNLRSSVGYVVAIDGEIVQMSTFATVKDGAEGSGKGKSYAAQLAARYPQGVALIIVAGMHYASYVQARGYDVIDSAGLLADKLVPEMLNELLSE